MIQKGWDLMMLSSNLDETTKLLNEINKELKEKSSTLIGEFHKEMDLEKRKKIEVNNRLKKVWERLSLDHYSKLVKKKLPFLIRYLYKIEVHQTMLRDNEIIVYFDLGKNNFSYTFNLSDFPEFNW